MRLKLVRVPQIHLVFSLPEVLYKTLSDAPNKWMRKTHSGNGLRTIGDVIIFKKVSKYLKTLSVCETLPLGGRLGGQDFPWKKANVLVLLFPSLTRGINWPIRFINTVSREIHWDAGIILQAI